MEISGKQYTVGADPELFLCVNGVVTPATGLIKGSKSSPFVVKNGAVQVDGTAAEFNIDPAESEEDFVGSINSVQKLLLDMVDNSSVYEGCSVTWDEEVIKSQPTEALELGCDPDFNAYRKCQNRRPDENSHMRTAGGHVHIGGFYPEDKWDPDHMDQMMELTKLFDKNVTHYSPMWDKDTKRREMYGLAGAFRPKIYGVECRSLSNKWITDPRLAGFVYRGVEQSIKELLSGDVVSLQDGINRETEINLSHTPGTRFATVDPEKVEELSDWGYTCQ